MEIKYFVPMNILNFQGGFVTKSTRTLRKHVKVSNKQHLVLIVAILFEPAFCGREVSTATKIYSILLQLYSNALRSLIKCILISPSVFRTHQLQGNQIEIHYYFHQRFGQKGRSVPHHQGQNVTTQNTQNAG